MKPILIKDLGRFLKNGTKRKAHYGLFECPKCKKEMTSVFLNGESRTDNCINCRAKTHGLRKHPLYNTWADIKKRCYNKKYKRFEDWGGRGITVCNKWLNSFQEFYSWAMSNGYSKGLTLDRKENEGNYEPSNCRWTDIFVQSSNKRKYKNTINTYTGINKRPFDRWIARISTNRKRIVIGYYDTELDAVKARDKYIIDNDLPHTLSGV